MKKILLLILAASLLLLTAIPVMAAEAPDAVIDETKSGQIYLDYKDDLEGNAPISGAEFTLYKVAEITAEGSYHPLIEGIEISDTADMKAVTETVRAAYEAGFENGYTAVTVTNVDGFASFQELPQGLYLLEETKPAEKHLTTKPTFVSVPHTTQSLDLPYSQSDFWDYHIVIEPKPVLEGSLTITKTVQSMKADLNQEFHFTVTFLEYDGMLHFTKSDGTEGEFKSGDTVTLKDKEWITLSGLPAGIRYEVTELEADQGGFLTTTKEAEGYVFPEGSECAFINTQTPPPTGDSHILWIAGTIAGISLIAAICFLCKIRKRREDNR